MLFCTEISLKCRLLVLRRLAILRRFSFLPFERCPFFSLCFLLFSRLLPYVFSLQFERFEIICPLYQSVLNQEWEEHWTIHRHRHRAFVGWWRQRRENAPNRVGSTKMRKTWDCRHHTIASRIRIITIVPLVHPSAPFNIAVFSCMLLGRIRSDGVAAAKGNLDRPPTKAQRNHSQTNYKLNHCNQCDHWWKLRRTKALGDYIDAIQPVEGSTLFINADRSFVRCGRLLLRSPIAILRFRQFNHSRISSFLCEISLCHHTLYSLISRTPSFSLFL